MSTLDVMDGNGGELVFASEGKVFTNSLVVAAKFGKEHKDVLRAIDRICESKAYVERGQRNFTLANYTDSQGKSRPCYVMDRDGFIKLAMGFTGEAVEQWQWTFIDAFNAMAERLREELTKFSQPTITDARKASALSTLDLVLKAAELLQVPAHHAQAEAVKMARAETGVDLAPLLIYSPAQSNLAEAEIMLEPTELGEALGIGSGARMNQVLAKLGLQKKINGLWQPTPEGEPYAAWHQWVKGDKSGVNLKWRLAGIRELIDAYGERLMQDSTH